MTFPNTSTKVIHIFPITHILYVRHIRVSHTHRFFSVFSILFHWSVCYPKLIYIIFITRNSLHCITVYAIILLFAHTILSFTFLFYFLKTNTYFWTFWEVQFSSLKKIKNFYFVPHISDNKLSIYLVFLALYFDAFIWIYFSYN